MRDEFAPGQIFWPYVAIDRYISTDYAYSSDEGKNICVQAILVPIDNMNDLLLEFFDRFMIEMGKILRKVNRY